MQKLSFILITAIIAGAALFATKDKEQVVAAPSSSAQTTQPFALASQAAIELPGPVSPFGPAIYVPDDRPMRIAARRARMTAEKYTTPERYYSMDLTALGKLARAGDTFALIQMAEQYESEWEMLQDDPGFDRSADPKRLSRELFVLAIKGGYPHVAAAMAVKSLGKNDLEDAYGWNLLAQDFNDRDSAALNAQQARFASLTPAERAAGERKYLALREQIGVGAEASR